jgi:hypothetical protein
VPESDAPRVAPPLGKYPPPDLPTIYVDSGISLANTQAVVKFYLGRLDPDMQAIYGPESRPVVQLVMPIEGFVATFAFLESAIQRMTRQGTIKEDALKTARQVAGVTET